MEWGKPPAEVAAHVDENCRGNVDAGEADLKFCAQGTAESCQNLIEDLKQVATLKPKNQAVIDEASAQVRACQGKGETGAACAAVASAIAKIDCQ